MGGLARMAFGGLALVAVVVSVVGYALTWFLVALVAWPGLLGVGVLAVVAARAATDPSRMTRKECG